MESFAQLYERLRDNPDAFNKKLKQDCAVGNGDVIPSIQAQTQLYMEWGAISAEADARARRAKYEFQEDVPADYRDKASAACQMEGKKVTINNVQDQLVKLDAYKDARERFIEEEKFASYCKHAVEAMKQRLFSLQSLNSRQKSELNSLREN